MRRCRIVLLLALELLDNIAVPGAPLILNMGGQS